MYRKSDYQTRCCQPTAPRESLKDSIRRGFSWTTGTGEVKLIGEMTDQHLVNAIGWCERIVSATQSAVTQEQETKTFRTNGCEITVRMDAELVSFTKDGLSLGDWIQYFKDELAWRKANRVSVVDEVRFG